MAAPSNESQGLKIAVAIFVMFTVILAVTTYFGFSNYYQALEKQTAAESQASAEKKVAGEAIGTLDGFKRSMGFEKTEVDQDSLTKAVKKANTDIEAKVQAINTAVKKAVDDYKAAGGNQQKIDELSKSADDLSTGFMSEPNRTFLSTLNRALELLDNQARLTVAYSADNEDLRRQLTSVNNINNEQKNVVIAEKDKAKTDLEKEHVDHNQMLTGLRAQLDKLQTDNNNQAQDIAKLKSQIAQNTEDNKKIQDDLTSKMKYYREIVEKSETILEKANGLITFVDWQRNEVRTDLTRAKGARPQMTFSVFDKNAPGLPTDRPKASIELTWVGPNDSIGRITTGRKDSLGNYTRTLDAVNPVRAGDQLYTPAFVAQRFALIGKIDMDRDGRDDREDLKRMIRSAGGIVDYDLPVIGQESGKISGLTSWYVWDDRPTLRPETTEARRQAGSEDKVFLDKKTEAIRLARLEGVRPLSIDRLLANLNWSYGTAVPGQVEAVNRQMVEQILHPRGFKGPVPTTPPAEGNAPEAGDAKTGATKKDAAKEEAKKDDAEKPDAEKPDGEMKKDDPK